jgi:hypothetical protein
MLNIVALACVAAPYPTLLAGVLVMLSTPDPKPLLLAFLLGGDFVSVTTGLLIVFVVKGVVWTTHQNSASPTIGLIGGVLSLVLAAVLWSRRDRGRLGQRKRASLDRTTQHGMPASAPKKSRNSITKRMLAHGSPKAAFALGLILNLSGIWYIIALKDIAKDNDGVVTAVLLILLFNAIMFMLIEVPLIGYLISPDTTKARVQRFDPWLGQHARLVAARAAATIGAHLIVKTIAERA